MYSLMGEILSVTAYTFHTLYTNHLCINCRARQSNIERNFELFTYDGK